MRYPLFLLFISILIFSIHSCGKYEDEILKSDNSSSSTSSSDSITGNNNNSVLTGYSIGSGKTSNTELSKSVTLTLQTSHNDISLGTPYVGRRSSSSETIYWSIPVTNISNSNYHCFIKLKTISFYNSSDSLLTTDSLSFVNGVVGKTNYGSYTDTCLTSNEKGFVSGIEIESNIYTNVSKIVVGNIDSNYSGFSNSDLSVIPQSYQTSGTYNDPLIRLKNQTVTKTKIWTSIIYLLDSNNNPIYWDSLGGGDIDPNSTLDLDTFMMYEGSVSKIHVFLNLDVYSSSSSTINRIDNCTGTRDEQLKCYKENRDNNIERIRMKLN